MSYKTSLGHSVLKGKMNKLTFKTVNYIIIKFYVSQTFTENTWPRDRLENPIDGGAW